MLFRPTAETVGQRLLRGALLLVVCGLCGTFDILNNNFARWVARVSAFPEEEEHHGKDRSVLVAAAQPSRRGTVRPPSRPGAVAHRSQLTRHPDQFTRSGAAANSPVLTGAGIFQRC
jgi:hypothetical protein